MAWTAPTTRATGDLITASIWNTDLTDNLAYLKTQTDLINTATPSITGNGGARAINGTEYQNTTKIRIVTINANNSVSGDGKYVSLTVNCKATSPADTLAANALVGVGSGVNPIATVTFVVPASYYYKCTGGATDTATLLSWAEWTLH